MTSPREARLEVARAWLEKARGDLAAAVRCADADDVPLWIVGFHCHQAVEKSLKGLLAAADQPPPRTHDLVRLAALLQELGRPGVVADEALAALMPFAISERYPLLPPDESSPTGGEDMLQSATQVVAELVRECAPKLRRP